MGVFDRLLQGTRKDRQLLEQLNGMVTEDRLRLLQFLLAREKCGLQLRQKTIPNRWFFHSDEHVNIFCSLLRSSDHTAGYITHKNNPFLHIVFGGGGGSSNCITGESLQHFSLPSTIQLLHLDLMAGTILTDTSLSHLQEMTHLKTLNLDLTSSPVVSDKGLVKLGTLTSLKSLCIYGSKTITDEGLSFLKHLTVLESLELHNFYQITGKGLKHVKGLSHLKRIELNFFPVLDDLRCLHLERCDKVDVLKLIGCTVLTNEGVACLKDLTNLHTLDLSGCSKLTSACFNHVANHTQLHELHIAANINGVTLPRQLDTQIYRRGVGSWMDISEVREDYSSLILIKNLCTLDLTGFVSVTDNNIRDILHLKQLQRLSFNASVEFSCIGLHYLTHLKKLKFLFITCTGCTRITNSDITQLSSVNRNLKTIVVYHENKGFDTDSRMVKFAVP